MGSLANMLLGQAAPSGSALSGLDPETQAALRALNGAGGVPETMPAAGPSPAPQPMPAPAAPAPPSGIMSAIMGLLERFSNSAPAKPAAQPTPAPPTPEELAARNRRIAGGQ